jgi:hypothetical protein
MLTAATTAPSLADAVLHWSGQVDVSDVVGSFNYAVGSATVYRSPGDSWIESWTFTPECASGPCAVKLHADDIGNEVTVPLAKDGATYSGSAAESDAWYCNVKSDKLSSTVYVTVKAAGAGMKDGVWTVNSFTATVIWDVAGDTAGNCSPVSDEVQGASG